MNVCTSIFRAKSMRISTTTIWKAIGLENPGGEYKINSGTKATIVLTIKCLISRQSPLPLCSNNSENSICAKILLIKRFEALLLNKSSDFTKLAFCLFKEKFVKCIKLTFLLAVDGLENKNYTAKFFVWECLILRIFFLFYSKLFDLDNFLSLDFPYNKNSIKERTKIKRQ
uniref:Uncharacterized protein n=1 Tax=Romanomermis culicivorax TaxID=13658 RepID=A0A915IHE5_ROMCU